ncbi:MAG: MFS transporter [Cyanobacteria bacterium P01_C01_bin.73]
MSGSPNPQRLPLQFWIVSLIAFINAVSFTIIIPVIYPYAKQFDLSDFQASLLTTAYAAFQFLGTPILGRLSDRTGRKPLLLLSLAGTVAANLIASLTPFAWLLFGARILDGITGGNTSIARAVIGDITSAEQRTRAFGIFGATFRLGFIAGPPLSYVAQVVPPLPGFSSLGMSFLVGAAIALIAFILCALFLPETGEPCDTFSLSWKDFGLGDIVKSVRRPVLGRLFLLTFFSGFTFTIFTFAFQPFFLNVLGQDAQTLAVVFAAIGILGFGSQVFGLDPLRDRFNLVTILTVTLAIRGLTFLALPTFPSVPAFIVGMTIFGLVNSFPMPLIDSLLSLRSGSREQGEVLGINAAYLSIANALGPAISGLLVSINYSVPFWIAGVFTLVTAGFAWSLKRSLQTH